MFFSAIDCEWAEWGDWGDCSAECGNGTKTRERVHSIEARWVTFEFGGLFDCV